MPQTANNVGREINGVSWSGWTVWGTYNSIYDPTPPQGKIHRRPFRRRSYRRLNQQDSGHISDYGRVSGLNQGNQSLENTLGNLVRCDEVYEQVCICVWVYICIYHPLIFWRQRLLTPKPPRHFRRWEEREVKGEGGRLFHIPREPIQTHRQQVKVLSVVYTSYTLYMHFTPYAPYISYMEHNICVCHIGVKGKGENLYEPYPRYLEGFGKGGKQGEWSGCGEVGVL